MSMLISVAKATPDPDTALSRFLAGAYTEALTVAEGSPQSLDAAILQVRALLRLRQFDRTRGLLDGYITATWREDDCARALAYSVWATVHRGDGCGAIALCNRIELEILSSAVRAEVAYILAFIAWLRKDYKRADELARSLSPAVPGVDLVTAGKAMILRGWLHATREEYAQQAQAIVEGIDLIHSSNEADTGVIAEGLQALAAMAREFYLPGVLEFVTRLEASIVWTADLRVNRFQVLSWFAQTEALNGDFVRAIPLWERARGLATTSSTRLLAHLDRAWIAHLCGETISARGELAIVGDILRDEILTGTGEEAASVGLFAELMAPYDPKRAREIFEQSQTFLPKLDPGSGFRHDRRLGALLAFSEAVICEANGDKRTAKLRAEQAWEVFDHIGYVLRAARAALFLHRLSGDAKWLSRASKVRELYPNSFVTRELEMREKVGQNPIEALSRRQREVLTLLDRGLKIEHAATELGIEPGTLRVHVRKLHSIFQVHSRAQLLHKYAQLKSLG